MNTIIYENSTFLSANGRSRIHMRLYVPNTAPTAVLQVVHGMAEHMGRYDAFARQMRAAGFAVCLHDHAGHGLSASDSPRGYFAPHRGERILISDALSCGSRARARFKDVPFILMGHSMGSFVVRCLATQRPAYADALILMGTGSATAAVAGGYLSARAGCALGRGELPDSFLDQSMSRVNLAGIANPRTPFDWLSYNPRNVDNYIADPNCGFTFTTAGFRDLFRLLLTANAPATFGKTAPDMPILLISGADDPVGGYGKGVKQVYGAYRRAGCTKIKITLMPGMRHEVLNEENNAIVHDALLRWITDFAISKEAP